jgi:radical SAM superfamily enzyme YgiQ (UPF0313 family)/protein-L-isoaspartate O-methyltransferase
MVPHRQPRVLLLSPGVIKWTDVDFGLPHLVSLGGFLEAHLGVPVTVLDLGYEGSDLRQLERTLDELAPFLLIGISCYSSFDVQRVLSLARFFADRFRDVPLVAGGYHASALPEELVSDGAPFHAVVRGEGELPLRRIAETLLGGARLEQRIYAAEVVGELDELPPYRWELLARYWPRAAQLGRKLQIYLSRGCPYHCTFCMERAKGDYRWRAFSPARALDELQRLARATDLSRWLVNIADPLFGFQRAWRREVLEGIIRAKLLPRQYWTLTRAEDLDAEDVALLARARCSIGVGAESGDPRMLELMRKTRQPEAYLAALTRLAALSRAANLTWAANIVVGHPGETAESMARTHAFMTELFAAGPDTRGWLSVDPFRLYPGSEVHEQQAHYASAHGTRFHEPKWWQHWYDTAFFAEHIDPSAKLSFAERVRFMHDAYAPLVRQVAARFRGQGRSVDRVFAHSVAEQAGLLSAAARDRLLERAAWAARRGSAEQPEGTPTAALRYPLGLQVRDPRVRRREEAVRRLLEEGVLRDERVTEALLRVVPEEQLTEAEVAGLFADRPPEAREGTPAPHLGMRTTALALGALELRPGQCACDLLAIRGYVAALLAALVGPTGRVIAACPGPWRTRRALRRSLAAWPNVEVVARGGELAAAPVGELSAAWLGAALPRAPDGLRPALAPGGHLVTIIGPRFRPQDLVCLTRDGDALRERVVARVHAPVLAGPGGWLARPRARRAPRA